MVQIILKGFLNWEVYAINIFFMIRGMNIKALSRFQYQVPHCVLILDFSPYTSHSDFKVAFLRMIFFAAYLYSLCLPFFWTTYLCITLNFLSHKYLGASGILKMCIESGILLKEFSISKLAAIFYSILQGFRKRL